MTADVTCSVTLRALPCCYACVGAGCSAGGPSVLSTALGTSRVVGTGGWAAGCGGFLIALVSPAVALRTRVVAVFLPATGCFRFAEALIAAARRLRLAASFIAAPLRFRVSAAFLPADFLGLIFLSFVVDAPIGRELKPKTCQVARESCALCTQPTALEGEERHAGEYWPSDYTTST